ncbi:Undecaprenyl-phosphate galactosephosphotransferase [hydrothermal vent metagenome]|uniref:Undecaprenyl-phosphate galactosephosphotransferase n=1 Tax=hydrothermal vent metagenome TaxID=652676 RepID=A0A1W1BLF3_9ZZZZ
MASIYIFFLFINLLVSHTIATHYITDISSHPLTQYIWFLSIYTLSFLLSGLFGNRTASSTESLKILKADTIAIIAIFSILFISKHGEDYSRFIVISYFLLNLLIPVEIYLAKKRLLKYPWLQEKIVVICDEKGFEKVEAWFGEEENFGFVIDRVVSITTTDEIPQAIDKIENSSEYYAVIVAVESATMDETFYWLETLQQKFNRLLVLPKLSNVPLINAEIIGSVSQKGVAFSIKNNLLHPLDRAIKNSFDFTIALIITILLIPILLIIYLSILIVSKANPIFTQERIGKGGKPFYIYKFRTMRVDADEALKRLLESDKEAKAEWEREHKLKNDPRITPIGDFLRKTSLDELPQLYNVLKGEMSLVGPRPIVESEIEKYGEFFHYFSAVNPGITGLWQVSGRNDIEYSERVQLDVWYVRNWSIDMDSIILMKTIDTVLRRKGSY